MNGARPSCQHRVVVRSSNAVRNFSRKQDDVTFALRLAVGIVWQQAVATVTASKVLLLPLSSHTLPKLSFTVWRRCWAKAPGQIMCVSVTVQSLNSLYWHKLKIPLCNVNDIAHNYDACEINRPF